MRTIQIENRYNTDSRNRAQRFLDQAEEDLLYATICLRSKHGGCCPINDINYLLHQSIEKWLKAFLHVGVGTPAKSWRHNLETIVKACVQKHPEMLKVQIILEHDEFLLRNDYPSNLRYREGDDYDTYNLQDQFCILIDAAFSTRRIVKQWLKTNKEVA
jgi:HEPN domain-containing protein